MASAPAFTATPKVGCLNTASANTARDGSGSIGTVVTMGSNGGRLEYIEVKAEDDLADCIVIIWLSFDGGTTWRIYREIDVGDGANADNTTPGYWSTLTVGRMLPASCVVGATITVAPTTGDVNVFGFAGDF